MEYCSPMWDMSGSVVPGPLEIHNRACQLADNPISTHKMPTLLLQRWHIPYNIPKIKLTF